MVRPQEFKAALLRQFQPFNAKQKRKGRSAPCRQWARPQCEILESRLAPSTDLAFALGLGSTGAEVCRAVATDAQNNIYITGSFVGTVDFDPGPGTRALTAVGRDAFVAKYSPTGNLIWAGQLGGNGTDESLALAVDNQGHVYIGGSFDGFTADFDPGPGIHSVQRNGNQDSFIVKLDSDGNFVWVRNFGGGSTSSLVSALAVDGNGNVHVVGTFGSTVDFDPGPGTFSLTGLNDAYVLKLDSGGNFVWAHALGNNGRVNGVDIVVDQGGNVFMAGLFDTSADFDRTGPIPFISSAGGTDAFVVRFDSSGNFGWVRTMGGTGLDMAWGVDVDTAGNVYLAGLFSNTADFDPGSGIFPLISFGGEDAFVTKLDSSGNLIWAQQLGGTNGDDARAIRVRDGSVYVTGSFRDTADFDPGEETFALGSNGQADIFFVQMSDEGAFVTAVGFGGSGIDIGWAIAVDMLGGVAVAGTFVQSVDFDPGPGTLTLTSNGSAADVFLVAFGAAPNTAPTTSGIGDVFADEDSPATVIDLHAAFADAESPDSDLTYQIVGNTFPGHFSSTTIVDGILTLAYEPNRIGTATLTIRASDPQGASVETSFVVTIRPVNDVPTAITQNLGPVDRDFPTLITLTGTDGDPEVIQTLTYTIVTGPGHGTLSGLDPNSGQVTYTPDPGYTGPDSFTFIVTDNRAAGGEPLTSAPATVMMSVEQRNSRPVLLGIPRQRDRGRAAGSRPAHPGHGCGNARGAADLFQRVGLQRHGDSPGRRAHRPADSAHPLPRPGRAVLHRAGYRRWASRAHLGPIPAAGRDRAGQ